MTVSEADECVAYLCRLFPAMDRTTERLVAIHRQFRPFAVGTVKSAIEQRMRHDGSFPSLPEILAACERREPRQTSAAVRYNGLDADALKQQRRLHEGIQQQKVRERELVLALDEPIRETLRAEAIAAMDAALRPIYQRRPATESPVLIHEIASLATQRGLAAIR